MAFQFPASPAPYAAVVNDITGSTYQWRPDLTKWVIISSKATGTSLIWEGDSPPDPIGEYKLWYSTDTLELYFHYCDANGVCAWLPTSVPIQVLEDLNAFAAEAEVDIDQLQYNQTLLQNALDQIYLDQQQGSYVKKKGGDSMEGPLDITGGRNPDPDGIVSTLEVLNVDSGENSDLQLKRNGATGIYIGDGMNNYMGNIKFGTANAQLFGATGIEIGYFGADALYYKGVISDPKAVTNKEYVDAGDNELRQDIIELEEEIDAIAPSVERGIWTFNLAGVVSSRGQITMTDGFDQAGSPIGLFKSAKSVWLNELDNTGTPHGFANVSAGDLIELFVEGQPDYGLFTVIAIHDETDGANKYWVIDVEFVRSLSADSTVDNQDKLRVKIIKPPTAGDNTSYLMKYGDTIDDADSEVKFKWNEGVSLVANENFDIQIDDVPRIKIRTPTNTNPDTAAVQIERFDDNTKSFAIRGKSINGNLVDLLYAYGDGGDEGDGIAYYGKQPDKTNSANIATGGFVAKKVNKAISAAGLHLGEYAYRRNNDSSLTGSIKSNGTTNPKVLTQFDMREQNKNGVWFGKDFYLTYIVANMFIHIHNNGNDSYVGKVTSISELSNGVRIQTSPVDSLCAGNFYVDSRYDVSFSYSKYF
jgi:hypothetical protein